MYSLIGSLTPKITTAEVVETSVTANNSRIQGYVHPDDHTQLTYEMTPGFNPFTIMVLAENDTIRGFAAVSALRYLLLTSSLTSPKLSNGAVAMYATQAAKKTFVQSKFTTLQSIMLSPINENRMNASIIRYVWHELGHDINHLTWLTIILYVFLCHARFQKNFGIALFNLCWKSISCYCVSR